MTTRRFEVEIRKTMTIEVDMDAESDYRPGETMMTRHLNPDVIPGHTFHDVIGWAAETLASGGHVGGSDGWADFPPGTATEYGYSPWVVDSVTEVTEAP